MKQKKKKKKRKEIAVAVNVEKKGRQKEGVVLSSWDLSVTARCSERGGPCA